MTLEGFPTLSLLNHTPPPEFLQQKKPSPPRIMGLETPFVGVPSNPARGPRPHSSLHLSDKHTPSDDLLGKSPLFKGTEKPFEAFCSRNSPHAPLTVQSGAKGLFVLMPTQKIPRYCAK